jgi:putative membrane protein
MLIKFLISVLSIMITAYFIAGITVDSIWVALWLSLFLGFLNVVIKPILVILTLPINILTLGLFTFVINAILVLIASSVIKGFEVDGFWIAMLFSIVVSIVSYLLNVIIGKK